MSNWWFIDVHVMPLKSIILGGSLCPMGWVIMPQTKTLFSSIDVWWSIIKYPIDGSLMSDNRSLHVQLMRHSCFHFCLLMSNNWSFNVRSMVNGPLLLQRIGPYIIYMPKNFLVCMFIDCRFWLLLSLGWLILIFPILLNTNPPSCHCWCCCWLKIQLRCTPSDPLHPPRLQCVAPFQTVSIKKDHIHTTNSSLPNRPTPSDLRACGSHTLNHVQPWSHVANAPTSNEPSMSRIYTASPPVPTTPTILITCPAVAIPSLSPRITCYAWSEGGINS